MLYACIYICIDDDLLILLYVHIIMYIYVYVCLHVYLYVSQTSARLGTRLYYEVDRRSGEPKAKIRLVCLRCCETREEGVTQEGKEDDSVMYI